jgi:hypothetical protein
MICFYHDLVISGDMLMALFSRRTLQRVLNENALFMTREQSSTIRDRLNKPHENYLATEWEQIIVNAASRCGTVQHEPEIGGSKPDLVFKSEDGSLEFLADVTAPSDQGFHDLNPVDAFEEEFRRRVQKSGWIDSGFDIYIGGDSKNIYRGMDDRIRLKIPPRSKWNEEIFNTRFMSFLHDVRAQPEQGHNFYAVSSITDIRIGYNPAKRGFTSGSHLAFTLATAKDRNPVYSALKSKGDQIKRAHYEGMAGIFLCDGGCQMVSASHQGLSAFSIDEVIDYFFRQFNSVWFVTVFWIKEDGGNLSHQVKLRVNPNKRGTDFSRLKQIVESIGQSLPRPQWLPYNARYRIKAKDLTGKYYGSLSFGGSMTMSAREVLEILAGVKTVAQFEEEYAFQPGSNPFRKMLQQGRLISKITVDHFPEEDDDAVTIEFKLPDSAVAPFRLPETETEV